MLFTNSMKLLLINPNNPANAINVPFLKKGLYFTKANAIAPPLNLCMVAGSTPPEIDIEIMDECTGPIDFERRADLVAITAITTTVARGYEIADFYRRKGVPVVMGGIHVSFMPQEALEHCDSVVVGEAEAVWPSVIGDFQSGKLKPIYRNGELIELKRLPLPRRDLLRRDAYVAPSTMQTARGCPFNCHFCSVTAFNGGGYRFRPTEEVVEEIKTLPTRNIFIVDDNIITKRQRTKELLEALIPLRVRWGSQATITIADDDELLDLARRSGCVGLAIGIETFSAKSLKEARKPINRPAHYAEQLKKLRKKGLMVWGSFVLGFDEDDAESLALTLKLASSAKLDFACFNLLTPLPGTDIQRKLMAENRIKSFHWPDYQMSNLVFKPKQVEAKFLENFLRRAWREFYSIRSIIVRQRLSIRKYSWFIWSVNLAIRQCAKKMIKKV